VSEPSNQPTKLYGDLADWWHLLSPVGDYAEEAAIFAQVIRGRARHTVQHVVEFGSGGGNNAFHLKASFVMTLVDASPAMLAQSARINPECEHVAGDMRSVRLGREFDAVFVHDAIDYMATREDLRRAVATAFVHSRRGGAAVFAPGFVRETFRASTAHGGHEAGGRGLRYLEWSHEPDPSGTTRIVDYAFLLRLPDGSGS
jgi:SAM-dependent methyltransferase